MTYIQVAKTPEIEKILTALQKQYDLASEEDVVKKVLEEKYEKEKALKKAYKHLMKEGKKLGDRLLAEKGLKREDVTEQQFYDLFLNDHNHA